MAAMLLGGARVAGAAKLTGNTAVKQALPTPACFLPPRPQPASWTRLCLQAAPRSSQVFGISDSHCFAGSPLAH